MKFAERASLLYRLLLFVAMCAACAPGSVHDAGEAIVRDSAGVRIVENTTGRWHEGEGWTFSETPFVTLEGANGGPEYEFGRPVGALRLADGRIVVADRGNHELRFFDRDGVFLSSSGRQGDGPGEFQALAWMSFWGADSLVAYDGLRRKVSVFDLAGLFHRSFVVAQTADQPGIRVIDVLEPGTMLAEGETLGSSAVASGIVRRRIPLYRYDVGPPADIQGLGLARVHERFFQEAVFPSGGSALLAIPMPFGRWVEYRAGREWFVTADTDKYELRVHGIDGALRSIIRKRHDNIAVTGRDGDRAFELLRESTSQQAIKTAVINASRRMPMPSTMPAFGRSVWERARSFRLNVTSIEVDPSGNIWVLEYNRPDDLERRWSVFDAAGFLLGSVPFPAGFEPFHIGEDFVLGRRMDDLDVAHVELYHLNKS